MMTEKGQRLIEIAESQLGYPYVFGAWGEDCTPNNRRRRIRSDHPTIKEKCQVLNGEKHYCNGCQWNGARMFDCRGFVYWCLMQLGIKIEGQGASSQYANNNNWVEKGDIANMPDLPCVIYQRNGSKMQHTGFSETNNTYIDCSVNVRKGTITKAWTNYAIPKGLYTEDEIAAARKAKRESELQEAQAIIDNQGIIPIDTVLRNGAKGTEVKQVQAMLIIAGYSLPCYGADGSYGGETVSAVKRFQADHNLPADGVVGVNTYKALLLAYNAVSNSDTDTDTDTGTQALYTVTLHGLTLEQASALIDKYSGSLMQES